MSEERKTVKIKLQDIDVIGSNAFYDMTKCAEGLEELNPVIGLLITTIYMLDSVYSTSTDNAEYMSGIYEGLSIPLEVKGIPSSKEVSCKKGCAYCCYMPVSCTDLEADLIIDYAKDKNILPSLEEFFKRKDITPDNFTNYKPEDTKCPFLVKDECTIYPVRPVRCRTLFVKNGGENCSPFVSEQNKQPVEMIYNHPGEVISTAFATLRKISVDHEFPGLVSTGTLSKLIYELMSKDVKAPTTKCCYVF